jgi:hypothetical protein
MMSDNPFQAPLQPRAAPTDARQPAGRHGCLTAWLLFLMIANSLLVLVFAPVGNPASVVPAQRPWFWLMLASLAMIPSLGLVWAGKKSGFYAMVCITGLSLLMAFVGPLEPMLTTTVATMLEVGILYCVLMLGSPAGWEILTTNSMQRMAAGSAPPLAASRRRHGCVTAWLVLCALGVVVIFGLLTLLAIGHYWDHLKMPDREMPILAGPAFIGYTIISALFSVIAIVGLWWMKRWGFYLWLAASLLSIAGDLVMPAGGYSDPVVVLRPLSCAILFLVLQFGKPSTWEQMD